MIKGKLFLLGTPIGNLSDFSSRGVETLNNVEAIFCEDTRRTAKLLNHFGISKNLIHLSKLNEKRQAQKVFEFLNKGQDVAYCSDAGMPCISDPGKDLVSLVRNQGFIVKVVPGPCSPSSAAALSGLVEKEFYFLGFLPRTENEIHKLFHPILHLKSSIIVFLSPHRFDKELKFLEPLVSGRKAALCREMTKIFEECQEFIFGEDHPSDLKGEMVLVIEGNLDPKPFNSFKTAELIEEIEQLNELGAKTKSRLISKISGESSRDVYKRLISN